MEKYRILAIAPYEELKIMTESVAQKREDLDVTVLLGDMEVGREEVRRLQNQGFDAVISRGGTAEMIREVADIPLVPIRISPYDMFRVIRLAQNYSGKYAIIGYPAIAECAHIICDLLQYQANIFTVSSHSNVEAFTRKMREEGYSLIVGDTVGCEMARKYGMNSILLPSGKESVESAFDDAVQICHAFRLGQKKRLVDEALLHNIDTLLAIYCADGNLFSTNLSEPDREALSPILESRIPRILEGASVRVVKRAGERLWVIRGVRLPFEEEHYAAFYITPLANLDKDGRFLTFESKEDCLPYDMRRNHFNVECMEQFCRELEAVGATRETVLILGEEGTEKDESAKTIYLNSALRENPLVIIDCAHLRQRDWKMIRSRSRSPLFSTNQTIYFKDVDRLSPDLRPEFEADLQGTPLQKSNRILFSSTPAAVSAEGGICRCLAGQENCLTLQIPPLRDRVESIPSYASLYLSRLNAQYGRQVVGFESGALELLENFSWEYNVSQLRRVLKKLILLSSGPYIPAEDAAAVLREEESLPSERGLPLNLNRSLEEIEKDVILEVLKSVDMNQTRAAKILGIGRSTMWRKLNQNAGGK